MRLEAENHGDMNLVGSQIRRIRLNKGMTQKQFIVCLRHRGMSISKSSYSRIEQHMRKVKDYELYKIAKCLGVRINDLFPDAVQSQIIDCAVSQK